MKQNLTSTLRHRITIQQPVAVSDHAGGYTTSWEEVATLWADVEPTRANERFLQERITPHIGYRITIRHYEGLTTDMRVIYDGRTLNILGIVDPDQRKARLVLVVEESE